MEYYATNIFFPELPSTSATIAAYFRTLRTRSI